MRVLVANGYAMSTYADGNEVVFDEDPGVTEYFVPDGTKNILGSSDMDENGMPIHVLPMTEIEVQAIQIDEPPHTPNNIKKTKDKVDKPNKPEKT